MIHDLRQNFNREFSSGTYNKFLSELNSILRYPTDFRVSETPLFLSEEINSKLLIACDDIVSQILSDEFSKVSVNAIPEDLKVPNESDHPEFFQIDFAICKNQNGEYFPKLIELQGFPTIYAYQYFFTRLLKKYFPIPDNFTTYYNNFDEKDYTKILKKVILGDSDPENVILLEITPDKQKTRIDFAATEELTGIDFKSNLDVKWVPHPNWFFKISKYSLPLLKGEFVPSCFFLNKLNDYPSDLENYVLKPLFSFAGHGVEIDLNKKMLDEIKDPENYILQQKINYAPLIKTPDEYSKVEIRMMFIWIDKPVLVNNLIRMSKGKMMGVDYNKNKTWVGSSSAFHHK